MIVPILRLSTSSFISWSTALLEHALTQSMHLPVLKCRHLSLSTVYFRGTACGNGMYIAFLWPNPRSNSLSILTGQTSAHRPHPTHLSSCTYLALRLTLTSKLPMNPLTSSTSEYESNVMFGFLESSTILGASMHIAQSPVGKVLSSCAMTPPMLGCFSTRYTLNPMLARSNAAWMPA